MYKYGNQETDVKFSDIQYNTLNCAGISIYTFITYIQSVQVQYSTVQYVNRTIPTLPQRLHNPTADGNGRCILKGRTVLYCTSKVQKISRSERCSAFSPDQSKYEVRAMLVPRPSSPLPSPFSPLSVSPIPRNPRSRSRSQPRSFFCSDLKLQPIPTKSQHCQCVSSFKYSNTYSNTQPSVMNQEIKKEGPTATVTVTVAIISYSIFQCSNISVFNMQQPTANDPSSSP